MGKLNRLCRYPSHEKFRRNRSIALRLGDKLVFAFYAEIQDGHQKWRKTVVLQKVASRLCRYPADQKFCQNRSISLRFRDKLVFAFYAEIQDGHQKWRENDFGEKCLLDTAYTPQVKNFVESAVSRSVSEINSFLHFMQKFKMAIKSGGKTIFGKSR